MCYVFTFERRKKVNVSVIWQSTVRLQRTTERNSVFEAASDFSRVYNIYADIRKASCNTFKIKKWNISINASSAEDLCRRKRLCGYGNPMEIGQNLADHDRIGKIGFSTLTRRAQLTLTHLRFSWWPYEFRHKLTKLEAHKLTVDATFDREDPAWLWRFMCIFLINYSLSTFFRAR